MDHYSGSSRTTESTHSYHISARCANSDAVLVSYPDPALGKGKGLVTFERFLVVLTQQSCDSSQSDCSDWFGRVSQNEPSIAYKHQILTASCSYLAPAVTARVRTDSRRARGRSHHIKMQVTRGYHMTAESAQPRKRSNVTRPFPFRRAGSGYETNAVPDKNVKFPVPFRNRSKIHWATDRHLLNVDVVLNVDVILRF